MNSLYKTSKEKRKKGKRKFTQKRIHIAFRALMANGGKALPRKREQGSLDNGGVDRLPR
jgi:hypothetical protein